MEINAQKESTFFLGFCLVVSYLNTADMLQGKLPTSCLLPPICCFCHAEGESQSYIFWMFFLKGLLVQTIQNLQFAEGILSDCQEYWSSVLLGLSLPSRAFMDPCSQTLDFKIMARDKSETNVVLG